MNNCIEKIRGFSPRYTKHELKFVQIIFNFQFLKNKRTGKNKWKNVKLRLAITKIFKTDSFSFSFFFFVFFSIKSYKHLRGEKCRKT